MANLENTLVLDREGDPALHCSRSGAPKYLVHLAFHGDQFSAHRFFTCDEATQLRDMLSALLASQSSQTEEAA